MIRVGVVSDIHGSYAMLERAAAAMGLVDLLLHAGDGLADILRWQRAHPSIPVEMVTGNCDPGVGRREAVLSMGRWRILLTHGHLYGVKTGLSVLAERGRAAGVDLVVYGHTHEAAKTEIGGLTLFNPGSLAINRYPARPSFGTIEETPEGLSVTVHYLQLC